ncbi:beta/gamma crystallin domain-containing protein [Streptomyces coelicoflavus]|uniref:beta/gamma crystallin domain-containing protein n=1 Tax=Streptomyces coelicoflavus TaxID=285562 RepID=UPI0024ADA09B|nr:beta/gamma crystallin domain-containing protein [Streptomyces coelicoflavus]MDI6521421.1 beta/gamma crystallin domain-containing protein [Streptomyces coelicoflavus]
MVGSPADTYESDCQVRRLEFEIVKIVTKAAAAAAAAAALVIAIPVGNAAAINEVRCGPHDYLQIHTSGYGSVCFANGGVTDSYQIPNVTSVSTGNNAVILRGPGVDLNIPKWSTKSLRNVTIDYVQIR